MNAKKKAGSMLIFWDQRLVFLATPKAGSSAVEAALESLAAVTMARPAPLKHMSAQDFHAHLGPYLEARAGGHFTTVALMREPIGWLRSWYRFILRDDVEDPDHPLNGLSFEDFARAYMQDSPPPHARIASQHSFLTDAQGAPLVDRIFRYEDMEQFVHFLEDMLDCAITLPRVNVPPAVDTHLSPDTEAQLRAAMAKDLALYASLI